MSEPVESVSFTLPVLAKPWQRAGKSRKGKFYTPAETRAFEAMVRATAQLKLGGRWDLDGMYELDLTFYLPDYKTRDWDNLGKAISDALNGVAYRDDNQVTRGLVTKLYVMPNTQTLPSIDVCVRRIGDWPVKRRTPKTERPMVDRVCVTCGVARSIRRDDAPVRRSGMCRSCNGAKSKK